MNRRATTARPDASRHCPECRAKNVIVTNVRYGTMVFFCPACEHGWSGSDSRRTTMDPRQVEMPVTIDRRVQPRRLLRRH